MDPKICLVSQGRIFQLGSFCSETSFLLIHFQEIYKFQWMKCWFFVCLFFQSPQWCISPTICVNAYNQSFLKTNTPRIFHLYWSSFSLQPTKMYSELLWFAVRCWDRASVYSKVMAALQAVERRNEEVVDGVWSKWGIFINSLLCDQNPMGRKQVLFSCSGFAFCQVSDFCSTLVSKKLLGVVYL